MDKPLYSQHLEDDEQDSERHDDQDAIDPRQGIQHTKNITAKHQEDDERDDERHGDQDTVDPRQDTQHAKNINAKTITAKENKVHTRVLDKTHTGTHAEDLTKVQTKTHTGKHTEDDSLQKTKAKGGESKNRTEESESKDHTKVLDKTHTRTIAKTHNGKGHIHNDSQHGADETSTGDNEDNQARDHATDNGAPNEGRDEEEHNRTRAVMLERARKKYDTWR